MGNEFSWYGIDFGTTNSAAFSFTGYSKETIKPIHYGDNEGRPFPSVVAINKNTGKVIAGREAKERKNELQEEYEYFSSIKTIIDSDKKWTIAGKEWTPEDIAAEILTALKRRVEANGVNKLDNAVVAVPNGFTASKKKHLRNAAEKAGINISAFIGEPTAAFCSNFPKLRSCRNVVVFDWGGGTLDVTVLEVANSKVRELSTSGMTFAGNDIDKKIAEKMHAKFCRKKGIDNLSFDKLDPVTKDQLITKCEKAKCDFEDEDEESERIGLNRYGEYGPVSETIDYDFFALLLEEDVNRAVACIDDAISKSGKNIANIDRIICVGGSSKLRPLKEKLIEKYGEDLLFYPERVMWDIAKGAAISSSRSDAFCCGQDIGFLLSDGEFYPLVLDGQPLPCAEKVLSFAIVDNNGYARFVVTDNKNPELRTFSETILMKTRGFLGEHFIVSCYIDGDFVFKMKIRSNYSSDEKFTVWQYSGLKIYWRIRGK